MSINGAGVILYTTVAEGVTKENPFVLVGNESKYLIEQTYDKATKSSSVTMNGAPATLKNAQLQKVTEGQKNAKKVFLARALELEKKVGKRVQYNTPVSSVKYRTKGDIVGIPKGQKDINDNDLIDTIIRECNEEIGFNLNPEKLRSGASNTITAGDYIIYVYELDSREYNEIKYNIQSRKFEHYSELFDIRFELLDTLLSTVSPIRFNSKTKRALEQFKLKYNLSSLPTRENLLPSETPPETSLRRNSRKNRKTRRRSRKYA